MSNFLYRYMKRANNIHFPSRTAASPTGGLLVPVMCLLFSFAGLLSCNRALVPEEGGDARKEAFSEPVSPAGEPESAGLDSLVRFSVRELPFDAAQDDGVAGTKADIVTSLSSFYACVSMPGSSYDVQIHANKVFTLSDGDYVSDMFWPVDGGISWQFDCANVPLTWTTGGYEVDVDNDTDLLVCHMPYPERKVKNTLVFEHAFARIDDVVITAEAGYTLSGVTLYFTPVVSGTFNLKEGYGAHDGTGWSWSAPGNLGSETNIAPSGAGTSHPDLLLVPGHYLMRAGWTASDGVDSANYSDMVVEVDITGGVNNVISMTLGASL